MPQTFTRRFDMRQIGRAEWLHQLDQLDAQASQALGGETERQYHADGTDTVVEWVRKGPLVLTNAPQDTNTTQGLGQFDRTLAKAVEKVNRMGKLGEIAARIKAKKLAHDAKADEWAKRLDAIDKREPEAFAIGDAVIGEREGDLSEMESNMRQLSNLPLAGSQKS